MEIKRICQTITQKIMDFSLILSVYKNDRADHFRAALESVIINQTLKPTELILVVDGPVEKEIHKVITDYQQSWDRFEVIWLKNNSGHAIARQIGLNAARYDIIAIMDSDDIACPNRFEKQISIFSENPRIDVLGGQITEFIEDEANIIGKRVVPESDAEIKKCLKYRCPMNFVTVMMKKKSVEKVGGYIDWYCEEDYYLWVRMVEAGMSFSNLSDVLVNVRVGKDMYARRGGWKYFKSEARLQRYMYVNKLIGGGVFAVNVVKRLIVQVVLPNKIRGWVFRRFARES